MPCAGEDEAVEGIVGDTEETEGMGESVAMKEEGNILRRRNVASDQARGRRKNLLAVDTEGGSIGGTGGETTGETEELAGRGRKSEVGV